jgi:hypothetical protein
MRLLISASFGVHEYDTETRALRTVFHRVGQNFYGITWTERALFVLGRIVPRLMQSRLHRIDRASGACKVRRFDDDTNAHQITVGARDHVFVAVTRKDAVAELDGELDDVRTFYPRESPTLGTGDTHHLNSVCLDPRDQSLLVMGQSNHENKSFVCRLDTTTGAVSDEIEIGSGFPCHNVVDHPRCGMFILCAKRPFVSDAAMAERFDQGALCLQRAQVGTDLFHHAELGPFFARGLAATRDHLVLGVNQMVFPFPEFVASFRAAARSPLRLAFWLTLVYRLRSASLGVEPPMSALHLINRARRLNEPSPTAIAICDADFQAARIDVIGDFGEIQEIRILDEEDLAHNAAPAALRLPAAPLARVRIQLDVVARRLRTVLIAFVGMARVASGTEP